MGRRKGNKNWTNEELELLYNRRVEQGHDYKSIETEFNTLHNFKKGIHRRTQGALERKARANEWHDLKPTIPLPPPELEKPSLIIPCQPGSEGPSYEELQQENEKLRAALKDIRDIALGTGSWKATIDLSKLIKGGNIG